MNQAEWWSKHWASIVSVATLLGLGAIVLRAYLLAQGSSGYLLLIQGDLFLRAALSVGLSAIVAVSFAVLVISLPLQFATMYEDWARPNPIASVLSLVVLAVFSTVGASDLLVPALVGVLALIGTEIVIWLLFRRFDIGSAAELYQRSEAAGDRWRDEREERRARGKVGGRGTRRRAKRSRVRVTDPARLNSYKFGARQLVQYFSILVAAWVGISTVFNSHTLWIPVEELTVADGSLVTGVLVVSETSDWITFMDVRDGAFVILKIDDVVGREFCEYKWVRSEYKIEC
jgi:hypothetical protein